MKHLKTSTLIDKYIHVKMLSPITELTLKIDDELKKLNRIREKNKVDQQINTIEFYIKEFIK